MAGVTENDFGSAGLTLNDITKIQRMYGCGKCCTPHDFIKRSFIRQQDLPIGWVRIDFSPCVMVKIYFPCGQPTNGLPGRNRFTIMCGVKILLLSVQLGKNSIFLK